MKPLSFLALLPVLALLALPLPAAAQSKIAVVNLQAVLRESTAAKSIRSQIDGKRASYQEQISKQEEKLRKEEQDIKNQVSVLSADALEKKKKEFAGKVADMKRSAQNKMNQLQQAYGKAMGEVQKTIFDIIKEMSKEKGFEVAIPTASLLYADESLDISQEILDRLNKKLSNVNVTIEESAKAKP